MATKKSSKAEQTLRLVKPLGMARPKDAAHFGIEPFHFHRLLLQGKLSKVARGIYRLAENKPSTHQHHRLAEATKRVPHAVVCLQSALQLLGECIRQNQCPKDELVKCAKLCRMTGVMRPYLEVLA
jgi:hypothetical protein